MFTREQPCSRARLAVPAGAVLEQLWPALASIATAVGLFLALSWFGLWVSLPPLGRAIGMFAFFVLAVAANRAAVQGPLADVIEGLRRLDRKSLMPHRPATAIADRMAPEAGDSIAVALWRAHLERALRAATALKAGTACAARCQPRPLRVARARAHSRGRGVFCRRRRSREAHRRGIRLAWRGVSPRPPRGRLDGDVESGLTGARTTGSSRRTVTGASPRLRLLAGRSPGKINAGDPVRAAA